MIDFSPAKRMRIKQYLLTTAMGKRLIGKAVALHPQIQAVLKKGRLAIVAGTTNGYVAEEILRSTNQMAGFSRKGFRRGAVVPPGFDLGSVKSEYSGDVVLVDGVWQKHLDIFSVVNDMASGDIILKGGNAVNLEDRQAGVYIAHPMGGTIGASISAIIGRRVGIIVPISVEKRIPEIITDLANELNSAEAEGPRMMPLPGDIFTELDAVELLTGAEAHLVAAGGIYGAEGSFWLAVKGTAEELALAEELMKSLVKEPPCEA